MLKSCEVRINGKHACIPNHYIRDPQIARLSRQLLRSSGVPALALAKRFAA